MSEIGDTLKLRYKAERKDKWIEFSPHSVYVELNGVPITLLQEITIHLGYPDPPTATLKIALTDIDIDMDTLTALEGFVKIEKDTKDTLAAIDEARGQNGENSS